MPERIVSVGGNAEHPRLRTRIRGLDRLLDGGLLAGDAYLVSGGPGTGKTTLGNQLAFQHAAAGESVDLTAFHPDALPDHAPHWRATVARMDGRRIDLLDLVKVAEKTGAGSDG